jgi:hypothetical protein
VRTLKPVSTLDALARDLIAATPTQRETFLRSLDADEIGVVEQALEAADLEQFIAGRELARVRDEAERSGTAWVASLFPSYVPAPFAPHMHSLWEWVWNIQPRQRSRPYVAAWSRGGAKSTSAELATVAVGSLGKRHYGLYISGTQDQADKHVQTLGDMLESPRFAAVYPDMARRGVTQYGQSKGWKRNRLHTASGFVVDALGLQVEARGIRIEEERPDFIILDDVDSLTDGPAAVQKKIELLTQTVLPAGSTDLVVLAIQNIIHPNSIFARLCNVTEEHADFLADRIISGPIPAVFGLDVQPEEQDGGDVRWVVQGGQPAWDGFDLKAMQAAIDTYGISAVLREHQHEVEAAPGGMFDHLTFARCRRDEVRPLIRRTCWVDPAVTDTDSSDSQGIQIDGISVDGTIYRLWSWEARSSPQRALTLAIRMAVEHDCPTVGVETDQGGDTWRSVYNEACEAVRTGADGGERVDRGLLPGFRHDKAGAGYGPKVHRAGQMLADYERGGRIVHVLGTHGVLETALRRFPKTKPLDLVDASFWSWRDLRGSGPTRVSVPSQPVLKPPIVRRGPGSASRVITPSRLR